MMCLHFLSSPVGEGFRDSFECVAATDSVLFSVYRWCWGATVAAHVCQQVENGAAFY